MEEPPGLGSTGSAPERSGRLREEVRKLLAGGGTLLPDELSVRFDLSVEEVERVLREEAGGDAPETVGRYEILDEIGRGAMGVVYRALDPELSRTVALKILAPHLGASPGAISRFQREATAAASISHPNLLPVYEIGEDRGRWFFTMELVRGETLLADVEERRRKNRPIPAEEGRAELDAFLLSFAEMLDALHLAHERDILHRDIKSSNVLRAEDGRLKLVDFGLAKDLKNEQFTLSGVMMGTPLYMSPEQLAGDSSALDRRSDVYSAGVTLYECLTLRRPYEGDSLPQLIGKILTEDPPSPRSLGLRFPADLEAILVKAMEQDRNHRYGTAAAFAEDLRNFVRDLPISARPNGPLVRLKKRLRRNRKAVAAVLFTLAAVVAILLAPTVVSLVGAGIAGIERSRMNRRADDALAAALPLPAAERVDRLTALLEDYPAASVRIRARRLLGHAYRELGESEKAEIAWAEAFHADPGGEEGVRAVIDLGRSFLEEMKLREALTALESVDLGAASAQHQAMLRLLEAELALARGEHAEAAHVLDEIGEKALDAPTRLRLAEVRRVVAEFLPVREFTSAESQLYGIAVGRFLPGAGPVIVMAGEDAAVPWRLEGGRLLGLGPPIPDASGRNVKLGAADLDGDGTDELIVVHQRLGWDDMEDMLVLSLRDSPPKVLFRTKVPHSDYAIAAGDVDGDGVPDLVLGGSYPKRRILAFRNLGGCDFEPMAIGELARIEETKTDARAVSIADMNGDGRNEVAIAAEAFGLTTLLIARFVSAKEGFSVLHDRRVGFVMSSAAMDAEGDGRTEVYAALNPYWFPQFEERLPEFLPLGLHRFDLGDRGCETTPVEVFNRLRYRTATPGIPLPTNVGCGDLVAGRRADAGPFLYSQRLRCRGVESVSEGFAAHLIAERTGRGVLLGAAGFEDRRNILAADLDGDGSDEIIRFGGNRILVHGLGGALERRPPERRPGALENLTGKELELRVAHQLEAMEFHSLAADAFARVRTDAPPRLAEEALEAEVSARGRAGDYDACLELLSDCEEAQPHERASGLALRAGYLERLGRLTEAARVYADLSEHGALEDLPGREARRKAALLSPWLAVEAVTLSPWRSEDPEVIRPDDEGVIRAADDQGRKTGVTLPLRWTGGSFCFSCEFALDEMAWSRGFLVGVFGAWGSKDRPLGAFLEMAHTSTRPRGGALRWIAAERSLADSWFKALDRWLPLGRWHRLELVYDRPTELLRAVIRDAETGALFAAMELETRFPTGEGDATPSFLLYSGNGAFPIRARFREFHLTVPAGAGSFTPR